MARKKKATKKKARKETVPNIAKELRTMKGEPLLAVETKLIAWSLALGAVLLVVLVAATETLFG